MVGDDETRGLLILELRGAGVSDVDLLRAVETVPREAFLPAGLPETLPRHIALPLPCGQTMPPPLHVALALEALAVQPNHRALEIGTGSGYATAVLARLAREVLSVERFRTLARAAAERLEALGIAANVQVGDGLSLPAAVGLFDRVIVHAALATVPPSLAALLADDGRIVAGVPPMDGEPASMAVFERADDGFTCRRVLPMRFTPIARSVAAFL